MWPLTDRKSTKEESSKRVILSDNLRSMFRSFLFIAAASCAVAQSNLAYDKPAPTVPPRLTEQSRKMEQRVYSRHGQRPIPPSASDFATSTMVVGNDGVIIIDTLESLTSARNVAAAFRAITTKPVKAVVYTHNHTDHILGIKAFVKEEDVRSGAVTVFAHSTMMQTVISNASIIGPILSVRSAYSLGLLLPVGPEGLVNSGLGPRLVAGEPSFIALRRKRLTIRARCGSRRREDAPRLRAQRDRRRDRRLVPRMEAPPKRRGDSGRDFSQRPHATRHQASRPCEMVQEHRQAARVSRRLPRAIAWPPHDRRTTD